MPDTIHRLLEVLATWPRIGLLFLVGLACVAGFEWRARKLGRENRALDGRRWYTPEQARAFFEAIGAGGRRLYAATQLTLDVLFPLVYGALFAALILRVYPPGRAVYLAHVPLLGTLADLLENVTTAYLALRFDGRPSQVARVAAVFTLSKTVLFVLSVLLILWGALASTLLA